MKISVTRDNKIVATVGDVEQDIFTKGENTSDQIREAINALTSLRAYEAVVEEARHKLESTLQTSPLVNTREN